MRYCDYLKLSAGVDGSYTVQDITLDRPGNLNAPLWQHHWHHRWDTAANIFPKYYWSFQYSLPSSLSGEAVTKSIFFSMQKLKEQTVFFDDGVTTIGKQISVMTITLGSSECFSPWNKWTGFTGNNKKCTHSKLRNLRIQEIKIWLMTLQMKNLIDKFQITNTCTSCYL